MKGLSHVVRSLLTAIPFALCLLMTNSLYAADAKGCKDSPYLSRFPGAEIDSCNQSDDDSYSFTVEGGKTRKVIEGKKYEVVYNMPPNVGWAPLIRNINTAMAQANWTNDYKSGSEGDSTWHKNGIYLAISMGGGRYHVITVTPINLTQSMVATAAELGTGIGNTGHAVVPGILFDTGKADVKDESKPALEQVAKLLGEHPDWKIWVVGHTDTVGQLAANMDLSKRRAAAVVQALVSQYHVAPARLGSFGNGPYAPVASNDSEQGRAQNRRVEIVKQ